MKIAATLANGLFFLIKRGKNILHAGFLNLGLGQGNDDTSSAAIYTVI